MKLYTIGRALGIGMRVAGRIAGQQIAASAQSAANAPPRQPVASTAAQSRTAGRTAGEASRGLARGVGGFLRPFTRVGGSILLEVVGVFFLLFVVVFAVALWRTRPIHFSGPYDRAFLTSVPLLLIFLYLSVSSFWRARKK